MYVYIYIYIYIYIYMHRNCLLQEVIEGKIKGDRSGRKMRKKT